MLRVFCTWSNLTSVPVRLISGSDTVSVSESCCVSTLGSSDTVSIAFLACSFLSLLIQCQFEYPKFGRMLIPYTYVYTICIL